MYAKGTFITKSFHHEKGESKNPAVAISPCLVL